MLEDWDLDYKKIQSFIFLMDTVSKVYFMPNKNYRHLFLKIANVYQTAKKWLIFMNVSMAVSEENRPLP